MCVAQSANINITCVCVPVSLDTAEYEATVTARFQKSQYIKCVRRALSLLHITCVLLSIVGADCVCWPWAANACEPFLSGARLHGV